MQSKIRVLSEHTINQIAAGEVIENASSVVKELVENALDSGATEICVEIKGGGRQLIRVTDNGCGMTPDDAIICLERHATSKIKNVDDIHEIGTMGFRGEAVPSIASISKFTLLTCPRPENPESEKTPTGTMVIVDGGKILQSCPAACAFGTTIEVKSLFFNVPVRKKFQRSPSYDSVEVQKILTFQALAHPHVSFKLLDNNKPTLHTSILKSGDFLEMLKERIHEILTPEIYPALCPVDFKTDDYHIRGYIAKPLLTRHNRTGQYLFINKRAVVSPLISFAVRDGYGTALATNRHPVFILHIDMPGTLVDVNVHPQKREVRLRQEFKLKEIICKGVQKALQESGCSDFFSFDIEPEFACHIPPVECFKPDKSDESFVFNDLNVVMETASPRIEPETRECAQVQTEHSEEQMLFAAPPTKKEIKILSTIKKYIIIDASTLKDEHQENGICFVDQRAAHSRIIYERLLSSQQKKTTISVQQLLIPHTFKTTPNEAARIIQHLDDFNQIGIQIKEFGPDTFVIDAIPDIFGNTDIEALLNDLTDQMRYSQNDALFKKELHKQVAAAASRAAVSVDRKLSLEEARELVNSLFLCESPYQCPRGKSTIVHLSEKNIEKQFQMRS